MTLLERINAFKKRIDFFLITLKRMSKQVSGRRFLFVGCGSGLEALCLKNEIPDSLVVGVDIDRSGFIKESKNMVNLIVCDGLSLPFRDEVFDFCYCYHVLEHVVSYQKCIEKMKMVLKGDGSLFLATPNRRRLLSRVSSVKDISLYKVIRANLSQWLSRVRGNFLPGKRHCGFDEEELKRSLNGCFPTVICLTTEYNVYISKNSILEPFVKVCHAIGILRLFTVSHTFYCGKSL